ncbi:MAG: TrkA C-terminal domain-containing protein [Lamprobacter sp.]|uniref:TrkA C-terminal domain-containing protein n=1 Tax=Lamprobacter sp. TaxID=3100796 RepID=UPI002B25889F|nr:TrkA C-terminal domain-containing protein [Lamprobacter sp.]MEA3643508.1 TrkA C-terminal domain-containing protein [Lamprobacter sp.]
MRDYVSLGTGFHVMDFRVPEGLAGKRIDELRLSDDFDVRALGLMRGSDFLSCESGSAELQTDDKLLLLGRRENMQRLGDSL